MTKVKKINVPQIDTVPAWTGFINRNRLSAQKVKPKKLQINFELLYKVMPYHLVSLSCLIEEYSNEGVEIHFKKNENRTQHYLRKIEFFKYWRFDFDRTIYHSLTTNKTTLCLWKIHYEMIYTYSQFAKQYFEANFIKDKNLDPLHISLSEIFNNIFDHSESVITGYSLTEYFPEKELFVIAVCDFGVGIPKKINDYLESLDEKKLESSKALKRALEFGFSTKTKSHNRGFGLDTILSLMEALKGEILIISNDVYYRKEAGKEPTIKIMDISYPGTNIVIYLDASKLEHIEEQDQDETNVF